ncbi:MAG: COX15/CtaA family protein [Acidobacteriota bacterium]|nr:COX15/CtaA family protein [Acidobacteriota bacterium]
MPDRFAKYAWIVVAYNLLVIVWGAFVRATGSGSGCGKHWPLCNGEIVQRSPTLATIIELTHRASSGIAGLMVLGLFIWAFTALPRRHPARSGAAVALLLTNTEALIGASLVLLEHVAKDQSLARVGYLSVHLVNTFFLIAALTLTAWWAGGAPRFRMSGRSALAAAATIFVGVSGAVTALGDTLFPAASLAQGFREDLAPSAHFLIRFRALHPFFAVAVACYLVWFAWSVRERSRFAAPLIGVVIAQLALGAINIALLAPVWMQLAHLLLADVLWILVILVCGAGTPAYHLENHRETSVTGVTGDLHYGNRNAAPRPN